MSYVFHTWKTTINYHIRISQTKLVVGAQIKSTIWVWIMILLNHHTRAWKSIQPSPILFLAHSSIT